MSIKDNIKTLGIPKRHKCPNCKKTESLKISERYNLAECMISNGNGLWALLHCGHCGYVDTIYPTRINGVECTPKECEQLMKEITKYDMKDTEGKNDG